ncbi:phosphatidylinositol-glycan biosynthesis class X protein-like [Sitophilus oryzae]|uniref:Phosphatidylinositol-glycan biosynthesis class X protein n=1 Tax=Sitophilus oryzae TaxID=7048 RepID=A0A6J2XJT8_SITOR|nr:phosphatidylinositol-glycan biosynthesis class X protein-like [Sitophilus oryzae]
MLDIFKFLLLLINFSFILGEKCINLDINIIQNIEKQGFHRNMVWLIDSHIPDEKLWTEASCKVALMLDIPVEMYVDPDQMNDFHRIGKLEVFIDGKVNIETVAHQSTTHRVFIYLNKFILNSKHIETLPIHLRYQKSHLGGYGKVPLSKVNFLVNCVEHKVCGNYQEIRAPKKRQDVDSVIPWQNITYKGHFDVLELSVPIGNLEHYPFVVIITYLVGCAGCIYILSILTNTKNKIYNFSIYFSLKLIFI